MQDFDQKEVTLDQKCAYTPRTEAHPKVAVGEISVISINGVDNRS